MKFLKQLNDIINSKSFNPKKDFFFKNRKNDLDNSLYTNLSTLLLLGYDNNDVINEIKTISNIIPTKVEPTIINDFCFL